MATVEDSWMWKMKTLWEQYQALVDWLLLNGFDYLSLGVLKGIVQHCITP